MIQDFFFFSDYYKGVDIAGDNSVMVTDKNLNKQLGLRFAIAAFKVWGV